MGKQSSRLKQQKRAQGDCVTTEVWLVESSDQVINDIHTRESCVGFCVVHKPSDHLLRGVDIGFDEESRSFYRTCEHGARHQDPDEKTYWAKKLEAAPQRSSLRAAASRKLSLYTCPDCACGCCDVTSKISES